MPDLDLATLLIDLLAKTPGITHARISGRVSFMTSGKVFVFARPSRLTLKLPADRIATLVEQDRAEPLIMGKRTMKEWAVIARDTVAEYSRELPLLLTAKAFVESEAESAKPTRKRAAKKTSTTRKPR